MRWCKVVKVRKVKMCLGLDGASTEWSGGGATRVCVRERENHRGLLAVWSVKLGHCLGQLKG